MTNEHKCNDFKAPSSLKDLLDFFDKLNGTNGSSSGTPCNVTDPTKAVLQELKKRLTGSGKGWVKKVDDFSNNGTSGSMALTITGGSTIGSNIHNGTKKYDSYQFPSKNSTDPCIKKYADAIIQNAFPLFGCLF